MENIDRFYQDSLSASDSDSASAFASASASTASFTSTADAPAVIYTGGPQHLPSILQSVLSLRLACCGLPVEVWVNEVDLPLCRRTLSLGGGGGGGGGILLRLMHPSLRAARSRIGTKCDIRVGSNPGNTSKSSGFGRSNNSNRRGGSADGSGSDHASVVCKSFQAAAPVANGRKLLQHQLVTGYESKFYALLCTTYRYVLFLDADNIAVKDVSRIFSSKQFQQTGAVLWPDLWGHSCADVSKISSGDTVRPEFALWSGQFPGLSCPIHNSAGGAGSTSADGLLGSICYASIDSTNGSSGSSSSVIIKSSGSATSNVAGAKAEAESEVEAEPDAYSYISLLRWVCGGSGGGGGGGGGGLKEGRRREALVGEDCQIKRTQSTAKEGPEETFFETIVKLAARAYAPLAPTADPNASEAHFKSVAMYRKYLQETDSGQVALDLGRHAGLIRLGLSLILDRRFFRRLFNGGDKDIFRFVFLISGARFHYVSHFPAISVDVFGRKDSLVQFFDGAEGEVSSFESMRCHAEPMFYHQAKQRSSEAFARLKRVPLNRRLDASYCLTPRKLAYVTGIHDTSKTVSNKLGSAANPAALARKPEVLAPVKPVTSRDTSIGKSIELALELQQEQEQEQEQEHELEQFEMPAHSDSLVAFGQRLFELVSQELNTQDRVV
jgi:hypothetical protein